MCEIKEKERKIDLNLNNVLSVEALLNDLIGCGSTIEIDTYTLDGEVVGIHKTDGDLGKYWSVIEEVAHKLNVAREANELLDMNIDCSAMENTLEVTMTEMMNVLLADIPEEENFTIIYLLTSDLNRRFLYRELPKDLTSYNKMAVYTGMVTERNLNLLCENKLSLKRANLLKRFEMSLNDIHVFDHILQSIILRTAQAERLMDEVKLSFDAEGIISKVEEARCKYLDAIIKARL